jgi:hypothetical protein
MLNLWQAEKVKPIGPISTQQVRAASVIVESICPAGTVSANQLWHELYEAALVQGVVSDAMQVDSKVSTTTAGTVKKDSLDRGDGEGYAPVPDAQLSLFCSATRPKNFVSTFAVDPAKLVFRLGETMFYRRSVFGLCLKVCLVFLYQKNVIRYTNSYEIFFDPTINNPLAGKFSFHKFDYKVRSVIFLLFCCRS